MPDYKVGDWVLITWAKGKNTIIGRIHAERDGKWWLYQSLLGNYKCSLQFAWYIPDDKTWESVVVLGREVSHGIP